MVSERKELRGKELDFKLCWLSGNVRLTESRKLTTSRALKKSTTLCIHDVVEITLSKTLHPFPGLQPIRCTLSFPKRREMSR